MDSNQNYMPGGFLVVFEGIDGVGKTTQLQLAEKALQESQWSIVARRNPGGTAIGEELRGVMMRPIHRPPITDLYISVAIQEALTENIDAERAKNNIILLDRGPLSLAAYQVYGSGVDKELGWHYVDKGMKSMHPELVIIYDCEPATAIERARQTSRHSDYFESKPLAYFERVAKGYQDIAKRYESVVIDARLPIDAVHQATMQLISSRLPKAA